MPSTQTIAITGLSVALLTSNGLWLRHSIDQQAILTEARQMADDTAFLLDQALSVLPVAADEDASEAEVIAAAQRAGAATAPYEKGGYVWVQGLGMRFSDEGRLVSVTTGGPLHDDPMLNAEHAATKSSLASTVRTSANSI